MIRSQSIFLWFGLLGLLAAGAKILVGPPISHQNSSSPNMDRVEAIFAQKGYAIKKSPLPGVMGFTKKTCSLWIATSQVYGENSHLFEREYGEFDNIYYLYKGRRYSERPDVRIFKDRVIGRTAALFRINARFSSVFLVARSQNCDELLINDADSLLENVAHPNYGF